LTGKYHRKREIGPQPKIIQKRKGGETPVYAATGWGRKTNWGHRGRECKGRGRKKKREPQSTMPGHPLNTKEGGRGRKKKKTRI